MLPEFNNELLQGKCTCSLVVYNIATCSWDSEASKASCDFQTHGIDLRFDLQ